MIDVNLHADKKVTVLRLPSEWGEVPIGKVPLLSSNTLEPDAFVAYLMDSDIPLPADEIIAYLEWMTEDINLELYPTAQNLPDIKTESLGKKMYAHMELEANEPVMSIVRIVAIYFGRDLKFHLMQEEDDIEQFIAEWMTAPIAEIVPVYRGIVEQLNDILRIEDIELKSTPTPEQLEAGIEMFSKLGYFNSIDAVATSYGVLPDVVQKMDYNTVFLKLLKLAISDKFTTRYREVMAAKRER